MAAADPPWAHLAQAAHVLATSPDEAALYAAVEHGLRALVGFRLFTVLRATPGRDGLERRHSSDPAAYPPNGIKPLAGDAWLKRLLTDARPALSADAAAVRRHFPDAEAIFGLGCEAVLNVPVCCRGHILGTMNLLHRADWFQPGHAEICLPFAALLGAAWATAEAAPAT